jgi:hypothetical protein
MAMNVRYMQPQKYNIGSIMVHASKRQPKMLKVTITFIQSTFIMLLYTNRFRLAKQHSDLATTTSLLSISMDKRKSSNLIEVAMAKIH